MRTKVKTYKASSPHNPNKKPRSVVTFGEEQTEIVNRAAEIISKEVGCSLPVGTALCIILSRYIAKANRDSQLHP